MPELPEVETVLRSLKPLLLGQHLHGIRVGRQRLRCPWRRAWTKRLEGARIHAARRRAKWLLFDLANGDTLVCHLGMTGRLAVLPARSPLEPHTHFRAGLGAGTTELRFQDPRRFGSLRLCDATQLHHLLEAGKLGPEPWEMTSAWLAERLGRTRRCVKACLLDQSLFAGVGNIYADEALHAARLAPSTLACQLSAAECHRLRQAVVAVLDRAIRRHGSTILTFYYGTGERGEYQDEFRVYQRTGQPCRRCGTPIAAARLAGRATHWCPRCQPGSP